MRVNGSDCRIEAAIGDAPQPDAPVIVGDVFDEVVYGIVGIGAFIDVLGLERVKDLGAILDKDAFGVARSTHVLIGEDIAILDEFRRSPVVSVSIRAVRARAGAGSFQQDRVFVVSVLGYIDGSIEADSVPHGDPVLVFGVFVFLGLRARLG
jgi:hypothetical protein